MTRSFHVLNALAASLALGCAHAQYDGPESVEYDAAGDRYFVSNTGDGTIKQRDQSGTVSAFVSVSPAPYGLEIQGDTLFACSGGSVKGYLLSTAALVFNLNLGGSFLNGITSDGTYLYVTDFNAHVIYRVDVAANSFITWVADTDGTPNGIVYDPTNDRLAVAFWGSNAAVKTYDRATAAPGVFMNTGLTNIDGITMDCLGRFLLASWSPDKITRIISFTDPVQDVVTTGLNNPADIDFDPDHGVICIPNSGSDQVALPSISPCNTGIVEEVKDDPMVIPNPAHDVIHVDLDLTSSVPFMICDLRRVMVATGTLPRSGLLNVSGLRSGSYVLDIPTLGRAVRFVKE